VEKWTTYIFSQKSLYFKGIFKRKKVWKSGGFYVDKIVDEMWNCVIKNKKKK
jgi:hypothetical protein